MTKKGWQVILVFSLFSLLLSGLMLYGKGVFYVGINAHPARFLLFFAVEVPLLPLGFLSFINARYF